jgi:hypothetical protein
MRQPAKLAVCEVLRSLFRSCFCCCVCVFVCVVLDFFVLCGQSMLYLISPSFRLYFRFVFVRFISVLSLTFSSTSPMVTSVGGFFQTGSDLVGDEISSGGFSAVFPVPSYQTSVVQAYLANKSNDIPPATQFNAKGMRRFVLFFFRFFFFFFFVFWIKKTFSFLSSSLSCVSLSHVPGRAVPDVAAYSESCEIVFMGAFTQVGGTSCASPTVAGIVALINDYLLMAGKKTGNERIPDCCSVLFCCFVFRVFFFFLLFFVYSILIYL